LASETVFKAMQNMGYSNVFIKILHPSFFYFRYEYNYKIILNFKDRICPLQNV